MGQQAGERKTKEKRHAVGSSSTEIKALCGGGAAAVLSQMKLKVVE